MDKNLKENGIGTHQSDYQSDNKGNEIRIFELILSFSNAQALTLQKNNPTFPWLSWQLYGNLEKKNNSNKVTGTVICNCKE